MLSTSFLYIVFLHGNSRLYSNITHASTRSAIRLETRKLGGSSIQQLVTSSVHACLAQRWARVLEDRTTCLIRKSVKENDSPSISWRIGATIAGEPVCESQRSTISKQSTSITTREKTQSLAKIAN
jgi:hypothetical protein